MSQAHNAAANGESLDEYIDDPDERAARQTSQQTAAAQGQPFRRNPSIWERLGSLDIAREEVPDEIEELLATEASDKFAFGNITRDDWRTYQLLVENQMHRITKEYPTPKTKLDATDRHIMYPEYGPEGEPAPKPPLDDETHRRLMNAADAKNLMLSLSVNSKGLDAATQIVAVQRSESDDDGDDGGRLKRFKNWLF